MKVLMINGSPHPDGCTARALKEVADTLATHNVETRIVNVGQKDVRGCIGCYYCKEHGRCVFNDIVNETAPLFEEADALIVGTPVYYAHANGGLLAYLDRLFFSTPFSKVMKIGATVVSSRRAGSTSAFDDINKYFTICGMPIASSTYWNEVHGFTAEEVEKDLEGLQTMRNLAHSVAFLLRGVKLARIENGPLHLPVDHRTNFIR